jgi:hypothetical protein
MGTLCNHIVARIHDIINTSSQLSCCRWSRRLLQTRHALKVRQVEVMLTRNTFTASPMPFNGIGDASTHAAYSLILSLKTLCYIVRTINQVWSPVNRLHGRNRLQNKRLTAAPAIHSRTMHNEIPYNSQYDRLI